MPRRAAKVVSAIFVGLFASFPLTMMARGETATAGNCLLNPTGETPPGSHWRYHIDHVNKRNCWYLRADGGLAQAAPENTPAASPEPARPSIADARAELRPQAQVRDNSPVVSPPSNSVPASSANSADAPAWNAAAAVATRWPDLPPAIQPAPPTPAAAAPADNATAPSLDPARAVIPSIPLANLSLPVRPGTIPTLIAAAIGALAFAGAAALISRRSRARRGRRRVARSARRPIWETTDDNRIVLSDYIASDSRDYRPRFAGGAGTSKAPVGQPPESAPRVPRYARR
jgi:hypothetical protein